MPVLDADLERALALHPREVGRELPAVVLLVAERRPVEADGVVRDVPGEGHARWPRVAFHKAALLLRAPQPGRPVRARGEARAAHVPAVPGHDRVAHEVA